VAGGHHVCEESRKNGKVEKQKRKNEKDHGVNKAAPAFSM
jgi:hypothetical protein